jgi:hypothetical protein
MERESLSDTWIRPMIKIPNDNRIFQQTNDSSVAGNLKETYNIDLSTDRGKIRFNKAYDEQDIDTTVLGNSTGASGVNGTDAVIKQYEYFSDDGSGRYFAVAGRNILRGGTTMTSNFTDPTWTGLSGFSLGDDEGAIRVFDDAMYAFGDGIFKISSPTDTSWELVDGSSGSGTITTEVFENRLYFDHNDTQVRSMDVSETVSTSSTYTLDLSDFAGGNKITFIKASSNRIFIGVADDEEYRHAAVYEWDGVVADTPIKRHPINAEAAMSAVVKDDVLHVFDSRGRLLRFNGSSFSEVAQLPFPEIEKGDADNYSVDNDILVVPHGMDVTYHNTIVINVGLSDDQSKFVHSGLWEYIEGVGLIHMMSPVSQDSSNISEHYQSSVSRKAGAVFVAKHDIQENDRGFIGFSHTIADPDNDNISKHCVMDQKYDTAWDGGTGVSYFVTPEIHSAEVTDMYEKIYVKYQELYNAADETIVKYRTRTQELSNNVGTCTWSSETVFTTADSDMANWAVGDEVHIIEGAGAGFISHVLDISYVDPTYTVTLDRAVPDVTASQTCTARFSKWKKLPGITQDNKQWAERRIGVNDTFIQLKVVFYHNSGRNEFHQLILVNQTDKPAV